MNKLGSDAEVASFKSNLVGLLKQGVVEVVFRKADGSDRRMVCTLNEDKLPPCPPVTEDTPIKQPRPENPNLVNVYDLEAQAWRSFKTDHVLQVSMSLFEAA